MKVWRLIQILTLFILELFYSSDAFCQERVDVIYMRDGSVVNAVVLQEHESSMSVLLMTKDTLEISYDNIDHIKFGNRSIKEIDEIIQRNRPTEASRFKEKSGFLVNFNTSSLVSVTPAGTSPFRSFSVGAEIGAGKWFAHRFYLGIGANAETFVIGSGNASFYGETRIFMSKQINTPFFEMRGGYLLDLSSRGRNYGPGISNYSYSGYQGVLAAAGLGYRAEISNYLLLNLSAGYQFMDLRSVETWEAFRSEISASVHRVKLGIGLSF